MSSRPKQADYKPSEVDKLNASIAMAEYDFFKQNYDPLLQKMRDQTASTDATKTLRSRANADSMQALTGDLTLQQAQATNAGSDMAQAVQGQYGLASSAGRNIQNDGQTNVLQIARKQGSTAQSGLAKASRMGTSEALARAKANQTVNSAKSKMLGQVVGGATSGAMANKSTGGTFLNPMGSDGQLDSTPFTKFTGFGAG